MFKIISVLMLTIFLMSCGDNGSDKISGDINNTINTQEDINLEKELLKEKKVTKTSKIIKKHGEDFSDKNTRDDIFE